ncbi:MAG: hypothetical protein GEU80_07825 [Dehalococcoidia bacterium]|nr:hypothetical protein [Dehalococcoidia bacterium]
MRLPGSSSQDRDHHGQGERLQQGQHPGHGTQWLALIRQYGRAFSPHRLAVRVVIIVVLAAASVWWLLDAANPGQVAAVLGSAHLTPIIAAVVLLLASMWAKAARWRLLLPEAERPSRTEAYRIFHVSQFLNNVLPLRAGDLFRLRSTATHRAMGVRAALASLVAERLLDALCLFAVTALMLPAFMEGTRAPGRLPLAGVLRERPALVGLVLALSIAVIVVFRMGGLGRGGVAAAVPTGRLVALWQGVRGGYRRAGGLAVATLGAWAGSFALHFVLLTAVGAPQSWPLAVIVTAATNLAMLFPATPGHLGVYHAAAAAPLLAYGVSGEVAVAFAITSHAVNTLPAVALGGALAAHRTLRPPAIEAA